MDGWMGVWMVGSMGGWVDGLKAYLRIAYSSQKPQLKTKNIKNQAYKIIFPAIKLFYSLTIFLTKCLNLSHSS